MVLVLSVVLLLVTDLSNIPTVASVTLAADARHRDWANESVADDNDYEYVKFSLGVATWATSEYVLAYGAIIESNRQWCDEAALPFLLDTTDYTSDLPPPRVATWGKVLALRAALTK